MTHATRWSVPLALLLAAPALTAATPAPNDPAPAPAATPVPPGELIAPPVTVVPFVQPFDLDDMLLGELADALAEEAMRVDPQE